MTINEAINKVARKLPAKTDIDSFAEPLKNTLNVDLKKRVQEEVGDVLDMF